MNQKLFRFENDDFVDQTEMRVPLASMRHRMPLRGFSPSWFVRAWSLTAPSSSRTESALRGSNPRLLVESSPSAREPQVPLCERAPNLNWAATHADVRAFYDEARRAIRHDLQDRLSADGGPTMAELELELEYVMEDAVVGWKSDIHDKNENNDTIDNSTEYKMRMALGDVRTLWDTRIRRRIPLQYLTHSAFWRDMVLSVGPGVLIPRPETELMVDFVLEAVDGNPSLGRGVWADLGTGSGALAVGVARALPEAPLVYAADIAAEPLAYAAYNAARYAVGDRVRPIESDWFDGLRGCLSHGSLSGIVSNPPYIPSTTCETLQAEVKDHEPTLALDGDRALAVDCLVPICRGAAEMLVEGGFLALETNGGEQAHWIVELLKGYGFSDARIRRDLRGVDRFVSATR